MAGYPPPQAPYPPGPGAPGAPGAPGYGPPPGAPGYGAPPGGPGAGPGKKKGMPTWGWALIGCGGLGVLLVGPMAALAIFGVRKYIATAKNAEAINVLAQLDKDALAAFEAGAAGPGGQVVRTMCPSASASVPATVLSVKGMKYQSTSAEWLVDAPRHAGFACLKFSMDQPQYFLYRYTAHGGSKPGDTFIVEAVGDLSGTGDLTTLRTTGKVSDSKALEITQLGVNAQ